MMKGLSSRADHARCRSRRAGRGEQTQTGPALCPRQMKHDENKAPKRTRVAKSAPTFRLPRATGGLWQLGPVPEQQPSRSSPSAKEWNDKREYEGAAMPGRSRGGCLHCPLRWDWPLLAEELQRSRSVPQPLPSAEASRRPAAQSRARIEYTGLTYRQTSNTHIV